MGRGVPMKTPVLDAVREFRQTFVRHNMRPPISAKLDVGAGRRLVAELNSLGTEPKRAADLSTVFVEGMNLWWGE